MEFMEPDNSREPERWVTLICTGQGRGGHKKRRLGRFKLLDGSHPKQIDSVGNHLFRQVERTKWRGKVVGDFELICLDCDRSPQLSRNRLGALMKVWLAMEPDRQNVIRDISEPTTAKMM